MQFIAAVKNARRHVILALVVLLMMFATVITPQSFAQNSNDTKSSSVQHVEISESSRNATLGYKPVLFINGDTLASDTQRVDFYYRPVNIDRIGDPILISSDRKRSDGWSCTWDNASLPDGPYQLSYKAISKTLKVQSSWVDIISKTKWLVEQEGISLGPVAMGSSKHKPLLCPFNGNIILKEEDSIISAEGGPAEIIRIYNSQNSRDIGFGSGWGLSGLLSVQEYCNGDVVIIDENGDRNFFALNDDNSYSHPLGCYLQLQKGVDGTYQITDKNGTNIFFDQNGRLSEKVDRCGNKSIYEYNGEKLMSITDASGRTTRIEYDKKGYLNSITDGAGRINRYLVDKRGDLVSAADHLGNKLLYSYDNRHRLTKVVESGNMTTSMKYDSSGRVVCSTNPNGDRKQFKYSALGFTYTDEMGASYPGAYSPFGRVLEVKKPSGPIIKYQYDEQMNLIGSSEDNGFFIGMAYDDRGNAVSITDCEGNINQNVYEGAHLVETIDPAGNTTTFTYDEHGNNASKTDALANTTYYEYDSSGNCIREIDPLGNITSSTYDSYGNKTSTTDALGYSFKYEYDDVGNQTKGIDFLGGSSSSEYDAAGNCVKSVDRNGNSCLLSYDPTGNLASQADPTGLVRTYSYDKLGNLVGEGDFLGRSLSHTYNARGAKTSDTDAKGNTARFEYDNAGQMEKKIDALGQEVIYEYNEWGYPYKTIYPSGATAETELTANRRNMRFSKDIYGQVTSYEYDPQGNCVESTVMGRATKTEYDGAGRPTKTVGPDGSIVKNEYDAKGNLTQMTDETTKPIKTINYDVLGRVASETDIDGIVTDYYYDPVKGEEKQVTGDQEIVKKTDIVSQIESLTTPDDYEEQTFDNLGRAVSHKDAIGNTTSYEYDSYGILAAQMDATGNRTSYKYDASGLTAEELTVEGTTSFQYDSLDRLVEQADPNGRVLKISYDEAQNAKVVNDVNGETVYKKNSMYLPQSVLCPDGVTFNYSYDDKAMLASMTSSGYSEAISYNNENQLASILDEKDGRAILDVSYTYGSQGINTYSYSGGSDSYTYDGSNELASWANGEGKVTTYSYDQYGDIVSRTGADGIYTYLYQTGSNKMLEVAGPQGSTSFAYDANGSLVEKAEGNDNKVSYTWDGNNQLMRALYSDGRSVEMTYDNQGRRNTKTDSAGKVTKYIYDEESRLVAEEDAAGNVLRSYVYDEDGRLLELNEGGTTFYYHTNTHGDVLKITDGEGNVAAEYSYDPWGKILTSSGEMAHQPLRFGGYIWDEDLKMYYLTARYYNPETMRFISVDPARQGLSGYVYCGNDPVNCTDRLGTYFSYPGWAGQSWRYAYTMWFQFDRFYLSMKYYSHYPYSSCLCMFQVKCMSGNPNAHTHDQWVRDVGPIPRSSDTTTANYNIYIDRNYEHASHSDPKWNSYNGTYPGYAGEMNWTFNIRNQNGSNNIYRSDGWYRYGFLLHCGVHPSNDYSSGGCLKLRPDRIWEITCVWESMHNTSVYGSGWTHVPWLNCGGDYYNNDASNNSSGWMQQFVSDGGVYNAYGFGY